MSFSKGKGLSFVTNAIYRKNTYTCVFHISQNSAIPLCLLSANKVYAKLTMIRTCTRAFHTPSIIPVTIMIGTLINASCHSSMISPLLIFKYLNALKTATLIKHRIFPICMAKIHTKAKRRLRMHSVHGRNRATRPKTFKSEESAKKYAESKGLKDYKLVDLFQNKPDKHKFRIE